MKYIFIFLLLSLNFVQAQERPKLQFLPGFPQPVKLYQGRNYFSMAIELREFKIGKKYCLWGSKDFDDECQDAAMEYAYGDNWREFKKVALDLVEYGNKMDIENIEKLFADEGFYSFYGYHTIYGHMRNGESYSYKPIHYSHDKEIKDSDSSEISDRYSYDISFIHKHVMPNWKKFLKGTEYKNFLLVKPENFWTYTLELSKNIIITFRTLDEENTLISFSPQEDGTFRIWPYEKRFTKNIYHLIPKIDRVEYYDYN